MNPIVHFPTPRRRQRGVTLIESLIAFSIMASSMLATIGLQMHLRHSAELSRQRSEAVRLAQGAMERLRSFSTIEATSGSMAYDDIWSEAEKHVKGPASQTDYVVASEVFESSGYKNVQLAVHWKDRHGQPQRVVLDSVIAALTPSMSAGLTLSPAGMPAKRPSGVSAQVPPLAHDLGDGRSVFKPSATVAWLFDNASGEVVGRCIVDASKPATSFTLMDVEGCTGNAHGFVVEGFVRFATADTPSPLDAQKPAGVAMDLDITITGLSGKNAKGASVSPTYECFDDAVTVASTTAAVSYRCVILGDKLKSWSGSVTVSPLGWSLSDGADGFKLCRYSADYDGDGQISNEEHPSAYVDAHGPLSSQNFLVIKGRNACPVDAKGSGFVNSSTAPQ